MLYFTIYKKIREVSVSKIKQHYGELGATFDLWYGESDASEYIDRAVNLFVEKGLTRESEGKCPICNAFATFAPP